MCGKPKDSYFPIKNNEGVIGEQYSPTHCNAIQDYKMKIALHKHL